MHRLRTLSTHARLSRAWLDGTDIFIQDVSRVMDVSASLLTSSTEIIVVAEPNDRDIR